MPFVAIELELGAHTNLAVQSQTLGAAGWTAVGASATANDADARDGTTTADLLTDNDGAVAEHQYQNITVADDSTAYTASVYVKKSLTAPLALLRFQLLGGTALDAVIQINPATGVISYARDATNGGIADDRYGYWRVWVTMANNSTGNTVLRAYLYPATNTAGLVTLTGANHFWGLQVETGTTPTSYIETTTAAVASDWHENLDVLIRYGVSLRRGFTDASPLEQVSPPGSLTFTLNNSASNSASLAGLYSPGHANALAGFVKGVRARAKFENGSQPLYKFLGKIKNINPVPGSTGEQVTHCTAYDWMDEAATYQDLDLSIRLGGRMGESIGDIVSAMPAAPANTDYDAGRGFWPYVFDDLGGKNASAIAAFQRVMSSEGGGAARLYLKGDATDGETLTADSRISDVTKESQETFAESDIRPGGLEVPDDLDSIINDVEITIEKRRVSSEADQVLMELDGPLFAAAGKSVEVKVPYKDPLATVKYAGGVNLEAMVAGTDYSCWPNETGGGVEQTDDWTVVATYYGSVAVVIATNNGSEDGYVRGPGGVGNAQARGRSIVRYTQESYRDPNATSVTEYGTQNAQLAMAYESSSTIALAVAELINFVHGDVENVPIRVDLNTHVPSIYDRAVALSIGQKITVTETLAAVNSVVLIIGIEYQVYASSNVEISFILAPTNEQSVFLLDDDRDDGGLDSSTYFLGYG